MRTWAIPGTRRPLTCVRSARYSGASTAGAATTAVVVDNVSSLYIYKLTSTLTFCGETSTPRIGLRYSQQNKISIIFVVLAGFDAHTTPYPPMSDMPSNEDTRNRTVMASYRGQPKWPAIGLLHDLYRV